MSSDEQKGSSKRSKELFETLLKVAAAAPRDEIPAREEHSPAPLSAVQQGLWLTYQLKPTDTAYNVARAFLLRGPLDRAALEKSIDEIVRRHEILRTRFVVQDGRPVQVVQPAYHVDLPFEELRSAPADELSLDDARVREHILQQSQIPFDLTGGPPFRLTLLRLGQETHLLLLVIHHIVVDVWSIQVFKKELTAFYGRFSTGEASQPPELPIQYADFALWQREWLDKEGHAAELAYWKEQLAGHPATSTLPPDRARPAIQLSRGGRQTMQIPDETAGRLRQLARAEGATLFMTLLAAFYALLYRYSGQADIVLGSPAANRHQLQTRALIGCFLNTLVLRCDLSGDPTFRQLLNRVRQMALQAYANQALPFEDLVEALRPDRSLSHAPLFQIMFNHLDFVRPVALAAGVEFREENVDRGGTLFDLFVETLDSGHELSCAISYNRDLYHAATIQRFAHHFNMLLHEIVADPDQAVDSIPLLTPGEYEQFADWNKTDADYTHHADIITQFYEQVKRHPDDTAFLYEDRKMSYGELNAQSNQLARYLIKKGARPGTRIGLALERSLELPVALLAILKCGGVYVPLDPIYPRERLRYISRDSDLRLLITSSRWREIFEIDTAAQDGPQIVCLDVVTQELSEVSKIDLPATAVLDDSFFIIYTSGSSGRPKGVVYRQRQIMNRLAWMWQTYPIAPQEIGCQKTALSFVDSMWELFGYLLQGAPAVIIPDDVVRDPHLLLDTLARQNVTRLWLVPSLLRAILQTESDLQRRLPRLNFWVCSGEALPVDLAQQFEQALPDAVLHNGYGTSEVWCISWHDPDAQELEVNGAVVPIGRPIGNTRVYITDRARNLAPPGAAGELWVSGAGVAQGYVALEDMTAERFLPNPFIDADKETDEASAVYARVYRTGDLARLLAGGNIEYLGRLDRQMNIRGMRIEPGEIEGLLRRHESVNDAAVAAIGEGARQQLVAYVAASLENGALAAELRAYLEAWLPGFMVPWRILILAELPLTPSGKVDRQALSGLELQPIETANGNAAPRTANEAALAEIWQELLGLDLVDVHTSFFDAGGHSLLGVHLFSLVEQRLGIRLPLSLLFRAPTIAQLALEMQRTAEGGGEDVLVSIQPTGGRPPFFAAHGVFGDMLAFSNVLPHLEAGQPFYGFRAIGLHPDYQPDQSIEAMAGRYIAAMRQVQSHGPYYIGGFCFGGVVAYEMARQLQEQGQRTALLAIIEGSAPRNLHDNVALYNPLRLRAVRQAIPTWARGIKAFGEGRVVLKNRSRSDRPDIPSRAVAVSGASDDTHNLADYNTWRPDIQYQLRRFHGDILLRYSPRPIDGRVTLIRARSVRVGRALFRSFDPQYGWGGLAKGGVDLRFVSGKHSTILREPNAAELARELNEALREAAGRKPR